MYPVNSFSGSMYSFIFSSFAISLSILAVVGFFIGCVVSFICLW